jgi:hypothetical protein
MSAHQQTQRSRQQQQPMPLESQRMAAMHRRQQHPCSLQQRTQHDSQQSSRSHSLQKSTANDVGAVHLVATPLQGRANAHWRVKVVQERMSPSARLHSITEHLGMLLMYMQHHTGEPVGLHSKVSSTARWSK